MRQVIRRHALAFIGVLAGVAAGAPGASAAINPSMSVTTPTPVAAGSTGSLGLDLRFSPTGTDSPDTVVLNLPPGVLADAALDNGQCITTPVTDFSDDAACQLGSGVVTAEALGVVPVPDNVDFYLTPPPAPGDLAGLAVADGAGDQIGTTNAILIRPSGDPAGVGVTLDLTLPNTLGGTPISISEIASTFTGVRFPATCPATAAAVTMSATSYAAPSTPAGASAPLPVTGCGSLAYNPQYSLTTARDAGDKQVKITTTITQTPAESPNSSVVLAFPLASLSPSIAALHQLCATGPSSGKCTPVGSVTASSPDYPTPLTGQAYLTGSLSGLSLTLVFPAPFPLTLVGSVDLKNNVTTFNGLPDIPLTSLAVTLDAGAQGLFSTNCQTPANTSTATLTDQNGDKTAKPSARFTITGCPGTSGTGGGTSGGGGGGGGGSSTPAARPHVTRTRLTGLRAGHPSLRFTLQAARRSTVRMLTVTLPAGMAFRTHRVDGHAVVRGVRLGGGRLRAQHAGRRSLTITLRRATRRLTVSVGRTGLRETSALRRAVRAGHRSRLRLTVLARTPRGRRATIHITLTHLT
jgi:hypothetical protein